MRDLPFELLPGETYSHSQLANHFKGIEAVGGRLHITDQRLVFRSHSMNVQVHTEDFYYKDIARVELKNTLFLVPNGLRLVMKDGSKESFVVWRRRKLRKMIEQRMVNFQ